MSESPQMLPLTPEDDGYHSPTLPDPHWSETHWFGFDQPGPDLSATIYPILRRNLNIAAVAVYVWDASACEPWLARYGKAYWHLPFPSMDLSNCVSRRFAIRTWRARPTRAGTSISRAGSRAR